MAWYIFDKTKFQLKLSQTLLLKVKIVVEI